MMQQRSRVLGIDPGFGGAVACIFPDGYLANVIDTPTVQVKGKTQYVEDEMRSILDVFRGSAPAIAVIEIVGAMPGQGVTSMFRFGMGWGLWRGMLKGLGIDYVGYRPQEWKAHFGLTRDKGASRKLAAELWPYKADMFARVKDHGRAEAALIAEFHRRKLYGVASGRVAC